MNIGKILGVANSNHLILRCHEGAFQTSIPSIGETVYTAEKQRIGAIADIFGPSSKPFISIKPFASDNNLLEKFSLEKGASLFTLAHSMKMKRSTGRAPNPKFKPKSSPSSPRITRHYKPLKK